MTGPALLRSIGPGILLTALVVLIAGSCGDDGPVGPSYTTLYASSATHGGCTVFAAEGDPGFLAPTETCISFSYDGSDTLTIERTGACFNCCPDSIAVDAEMIGSRIIITEWEDLFSGGCDCLCLFELDYTIGRVAPGEYTIAVLGPYDEAHQSDPIFQFTVDLRRTPSGTFCVERTGYPWGDGTSLATTVTDLGDCQPRNVAGAAVDTVLENCIVFDYDRLATLTIDHRNAIFNCCADSAAVFAQVRHDTICVVEQEFFVHQPPCHCVCPYNLSYTINGLSPGAYTLKVEGPYLNSYHDTLTFDINLTAADTGRYCIPWPY